MKKWVKLFLGIVVFFSFISPVLALNINVEKIGKESIVIAELNNPAVFDLVITNNEKSDNFEVYTLVGVSMSPKGTFSLPLGETTMEVKAYLSDDLMKYRGPFIFEYQLRSPNVGIFRDNLMVNIVELNEVVEVSPVFINPEDEEATISIKSVQNTNLNNLSIKLKSVFFEFEEEISLEPFESINISKEINWNDLRKIKAGPYVLTLDLELEDAKARLEGIISYLEKEGTSVYRSSSGFLIRENIIGKTNEGNIPLVMDIDTRRDVLTRLFTSYSIEPISTRRSGLFVDYSWEKSLEPGESFEVISTTNYTFPFLLIVLIVVVALVSKLYIRTSLTMKKRVSYVKTKGGELALKINLRLKANKNLRNIKIVDHIPLMTKLYDKFGRRPDRIDEKKRKIYWDVESLNAGEERVLSYIIYSKIKVVGRFEIPAAMAVYEVGEVKEKSSSNRTFFVADSAGN